MGGPESVGDRRAIGFVRSMRWILWALLFVAVVTTLEGMPALQAAAGAGRLPRALSALPVALVGLFIAGYGVYRFMLVRSGRYPAGKAVLQLGLMLLVFVLLFRWAGEGWAARGEGPVDLAAALAGGDPEVRALAAEVIRARPRPEALAHAARLVDLLGDPSAEVRRQAHATLVALAGQDLGRDAASAPRWRDALAPAR